MAVGRPIRLTPNVARKIVTATATASQTSFTPTGGYRIGELAVFRNGVRLVSGRDYTAVDGTTVSLQSACTLGDVVEFQIFDNFNIADAIGANGNQSMGGDLTVGLTTMYSGATGIVSTTQFFGDGSNLTGVANTDYIDAASITSAGIVSVTNTTDSTSTTTGALIVSGGVGIAKSLFVGNNVTIGGTVTYEDVTNVDSVGIITARLGILVNGGRGIDIAGGGLEVTGVGTFKGILNADAEVTAAGGVDVTGGVKVVGISTLNRTTLTDAVISVGATVGMTTITTTQARIGTAVTFAQSYINFNQTLIEKTNTAGTTLGAATTCSLVKGMIFYCTGNESGNLTVNFTQVGRTGDSDAGIALTSVMGVGECISPTVILTPNNSGVINAVKIDDVAQTFEENGGAFSAGADGYDSYSFTILRTGTSSTGFLVLGSLTNHT